MFYILSILLVGSEHPIFEVTNQRVDLAWLMIDL